MGELFKPIAPGPSAAIEADLRNRIAKSSDPVETKALERQLRILCDQAVYGPVPEEEDAEWARIHHDEFVQSLLITLREAGGYVAHSVYMRSCDGTFEDKAAPCEPVNDEAWCDFADRVLRRPPREPDDRRPLERLLRPRTDETEEETLLAALAAYGKRAGHTPPPSERWLATLRHLRKKFTAPEP